MFKNIANSGLICLLHADNDAPLKLWDKKLRDGKLKRLPDSDIKGRVLCFNGKVPHQSYLSCPADIRSHLGIRYPYLVLTAKTIDSGGGYFAFDVQVVDDTGTRRRYRIATGQVTFDVQPFHARIPLVMEDGWNNVVLPLHHLTYEIYGTKYVETLRLQVYPSCLLKRIYLADRDYEEEELPPEFHRQPTPLFQEHSIKRIYDEAKKMAASAAKEKGDRPKRGDGGCANSPPRQPIPRVITVHRALIHPMKPTYSSL